MATLRVRFGKAVRRRREAAGYTQESFADHIGVHRNYMGTVERGETNITLENIERIARGLRISVAELMHEAES
jgi:transcriptional regulator with XRE-family HTH domain